MVTFATKFRKINSTASLQRLLGTSCSNHKENSTTSSRRRSSESDKKGVLILFDIKIRSVKKSILKVRHKNITKMEETKSTMSPLDMNLRIQIT